jgi:hypothetical protein
MSVLRLSAVQRMILTYLLDQAKQGKAPTIIADGHKKTRVGFFPALEAEGVATNSTTLYFLRHHGLIDQVMHERESGTGYFRLTFKAEQLLSVKLPPVAVTPKEWKRRTEAQR